MNEVRVDTKASERFPLQEEAGRTRRRGLGLSGKLLVYTALFVMLAEVLIFVPSVSNFRRTWLAGRLEAAQLAALSAEAAPEGRIPEALRAELLRTAKVRAVALKREGMRQLILQDDMPAEPIAHYDLRNPSWLDLLGDALMVYLQASDRAIRVTGTPTFGGGHEIEIVVMERPLQDAMVGFGLRILGLSVAISLFTATLIYFVLNQALIRPMQRITRHMVRFSERPEDVSRIIKASDRGDEIGTAERELAAMQTQLAQALQQKSRLAALGLAVSKINHDLRNLLGNAQLISDRFAGIKDPTVQRVAPKLVSALDRAVKLCTDTLRYGRAEEAPPKRELFKLRPLVEEVGIGLMLPRERVGFAVEMARELEIDADRDQLYRVLNNLVRNATEALEAMPAGKEQGLVRIVAGRDGSGVEIVVSDNGPGVPPKARENLFAPFKASANKGGTGLGLAIAAELLRAHGGDIVLVDRQGGAAFRIVLPDREG